MALFSNHIIVIPAYEPDQKLINLLQEIKAKTNYHVIVVDDGSSAHALPFFTIAKQYATVIKHSQNKGKGQAIKTALESIKNNCPQNSVIAIADADGQHKVDDIIKVCNQSDANSGALIIGSRQFTGKVPLKSKLGNSVARFIFSLVSKSPLNDTQTGLRAFRSNMIPFMTNIDGTRYEYEMNVLLECSLNKVEIIEVPIDTVYIGENESSHYRAFKDSFRIFKNILKFSLSSILAFIIDFLFYSIIIRLTSSIDTGISLILSNVLARVVSSGVNYYINRKYVFKHQESVLKSALKYYALAICILILNTVMLTFIVENILSNKFIAKILVESILFIISWSIQRFFVFKKKSTKDSVNFRNDY